MLVQVYTEKHTARCEYAFDLLLHTLLGLEYQLFTDKNRLDSQQPIINYSTTAIDKALQIVPHTILFETSIKAQNIEVEGSYAFFRTSQNQWAFDWFASAFYMATRYEEYLPSELDNHGRFRAENSLAYKHGFLKKAVVHRWALELKQALKQYYPHLQFRQPTYTYLSTIDIDAAYAYKAKGVKRLLGGCIKAILRKDLEDVRQRFSYLFLGSKDPFDVYETFDHLHHKASVKTKYFFLVGKNGAYDKNILISKKPYRQLIKNIATSSDVGLHPSYQSNSHAELLQQEKQQLTAVTDSVINSSRQHFLKLKFPETYQNLIKSGITHDYTMGFASQLGFRAGLCVPYRFFDLSTNTLTKLTLVPFQIMDGTLNQYLSLSRQDAWVEIMQIYQEVKSLDGMLVTLWHNESLSEMRNWKGWKSLYADLIKQCSK